MRFVLLSLFLTLPCIAQTPQPEKESTSDLRAGIVMFSVDDKAAKNVTWLERTANHEYFLKSGRDQESYETLKVSSKEAKELNQKFTAVFLKLMFEFPSDHADCKLSLHLVMKDDEQDVCQKEEKKTQEIKPFLESLQKKF